MIKHTIGNDTVHIEYDENRAFWGCEPWYATWGGYDEGCLLGQGYTQQEALEDLLEKSEC